MSERHVTVTTTCFHRLLWSSWARLFGPFRHSTMSLTRQNTPDEQEVAQLLSMQLGASSSASSSNMFHQLTLVLGGQSALAKLRAQLDQKRCHKVLIIEIITLTCWYCKRQGELHSGRIRIITEIDDTARCCQGALFPDAVVP